MKEKWEKIFKDRKTENLVFMLILLIVTLVIINRILKDEPKNDNDSNTVNTAVLASRNMEITLDQKLEEILAKIKGVGKVNVLVTYSENEFNKIPMYNENNTKNTTEEVDKNGNTKKNTSDIIQKEIVLGADQNPVIKSIENPRIEGAIITAEGAGNIDIKTNIISAVEAATGLATHKIQVFEMNKKN